MNPIEVGGGCHVTDHTFRRDEWRRWRIGNDDVSDPLHDVSDTKSITSRQIQWRGRLLLHARPQLARLPHRESAVHPMT